MTGVRRSLAAGGLARTGPTVPNGESARATYPGPSSVPRAHWMLRRLAGFGFSGGDAAEEANGSVAEGFRRWEEAHHQVCLARKIEEESGVREHAILLKEKEYQLFLAAESGDPQDRRPAPVPLLQVHRRPLRDERGQVVQVGPDAGADPAPDVRPDLEQAAGRDLHRGAHGKKGVGRELEARERFVTQADGAGHGDPPELHLRQAT